MITWAIFWEILAQLTRKCPGSALSAWWCYVSSLKNDGVKVKWVSDDILYEMEVIQAMFETTNQYINH
jgi:hypothetical protein